jgi:hypothetical protein
MSWEALLGLIMHQRIRNLREWAFRPIAESIAAGLTVSLSLTVSLWQLISIKSRRIKTILTLLVLDIENGFILL